MGKKEKEVLKFMMEELIITHINVLKDIQKILNGKSHLQTSGNLLKTRNIINQKSISILF